MKTGRPQQLPATMKKTVRAGPVASSGTVLWAKPWADSSRALLVIRPNLVGHDGGAKSAHG